MVGGASAMATDNAFEKMATFEKIWQTTSSIYEDEATPDTVKSLAQHSLEVIYDLQANNQRGPEAQQQIANATDKLVKGLQGNGTIQEKYKELGADLANFLEQNDIKVTYPNADPVQGPVDPLQKSAYDAAAAASGGPVEPSEPQKNVWKGNQEGMTINIPKF
jgi:hypothetical protein